MDIMGWDIVLGCSLNRINQQLTANMSGLISTFIVNDNAITIQGEFGAWQLEMYGANQLLRFSTPIKNGSLTIRRSNGSSDQVDISGINPIMELQLAFIDNVSVANVKDLKFNCTITGMQPGDTTPGAVTSVNPDSSGKISQQNDPETWGLLQDLLPKVFIANQDKLAYVFAQVNLAPPESASWMAPKRFVYSYYEPVGGSTGYLVIYSVLTDRAVPTSIPAADGALFDADHELFLMISSGEFLQRLLMPTLPDAYGHGASAANFVYAPYDNTSGQIVNAGNLACGKVKEGAVDYYPEITNLTINVDNDAVTSTARGKFAITGLAHAYVTFSVSTRNPLVYDAANNSLAFQRDPNPSHKYDKHIPWWEYVATVVGGAIILAIVDVVIDLVTNSLAGSVSGAVWGSGENSLAYAASTVIQWNGIEHFQVEDAGLATAFYMRGNYQ